MGSLSTRSTDQDTQLVADVVEDVWLKDASAPDPDHVLISVDQELQPGSIPVVRDPLESEDGCRQNFQSKKRASLCSLGEKVVGRDPVRPLIEGKEDARQFLSLAAFLKPGQRTHLRKRSVRR